MPLLRAHSPHQQAQTSDSVGSSSQPCPSVLSVWSCFCTHLLQVLSLCTGLLGARGTRMWSRNSAWMHPASGLAATSVLTQLFTRWPQSICSVPDILSSEGGRQGSPLRLSPAPRSLLPRCRTNHKAVPLYVPKGNHTHVLGTMTVTA